MKTREFGQPCASVPQPGKCRVCGVDESRVRSAGWIVWADESRTLCDNPACIAEAKRELGLLP